MKAVLIHAVEPGRIVDLAHDLRPHAVAEAAFVVRAMGERFPRGTVHVVVVDPGVGGRRRALAIRCRDGSVLVGPDNGVMMPLAEALGLDAAFSIAPERLPATARVGTTFDGRDVFAPAAAFLARGGRPERLGPRVEPARLSLRPARRTDGGADGRVVHVDHFGNLITDVPTRWVPRGTRAVGLLGARGARRLPWTTSYEAGGPGRAFALGSSFGTVEIAVGEGRAADRLHLGPGARVRLRWIGAGPARRRAEKP